MKNREMTAKKLRITARSILIVIAVFWFIFALLSGSEGFGGERGISSGLLNSPNTLPWLTLFILVWTAWKWELIGGTLIIISGFFFFFFFSAYREPFVFLFVIVPLFVLGAMFLKAWQLTNHKKTSQNHEKNEM